MAESHIHRGQLSIAHHDILHKIMTNYSYIYTENYYAHLQICDYIYCVLIYIYY